MISCLIFERERENGSLSRKRPCQAQKPLKPPVPGAFITLRPIGVVMIITLAAKSVERAVNKKATPIKKLAIRRFHPWHNFIQTMRIKVISNIRNLVSTHYDIRFLQVHHRKLT